MNDVVLNDEAHLYANEIEKIIDFDLSLEDKERIAKAYDIAQKAHTGQVRDSGEPFFEHPKEVARILSSFKVDVDTVIAGLLHDVVEDCDYPIESVRENFGNEVARVVDGVTKISNLKLNEKLNKAEMKSIEKIETIRKMLFAMSSDVRVILVKLCDRLHNMRTLNFVKREKQLAKSDETLKIYAPIAHRLGIHRIKAELEDLAFSYLYPDLFEELKIKIENKILNSQKSMEEYNQIISGELERQGINGYVAGRTKHIYSIWEKMSRKGKNLDEIYDYIALRIITDSQSQCYAALGIVHSIWPPMPGRIKDYIATPKLNGYRSLHTTVITNKGEPLEIQIRDWEMHDEAEFGFASHWTYKQGMNNQKTKFLQNIMELHKEIAQSAFDISDFEYELKTSETFVFTPNGEIIHLAKEATPIDFAYAIHTDVGNHFGGAKVNGKIVPISYRLQNGDVVEIIINRAFQGPSIDWLKYASSSRTKAKIKKYYRQKNEQILIEKGKDRFRDMAKKLDMSMDDMLTKLKEGTFYLRFNVKNDEDLYAKIALEDLNMITVRHAIVGDEKKPQTFKTKVSSGKPSVIVDNLDGVDYYLAKCCLPVPGDEIIGITSKRGIGVHRLNCKNIRDVDEAIKVNVRWNINENTSFMAVLSLDMKSKEVMNVVRNCINNEKGYIEKFEMEKTVNVMNTKIRIKVNSTEHLTRIINKISEIDGIYSVRRI